MHPGKSLMLCTCFQVPDVVGEGHIYGRHCCYANSRYVVYHFCLLVTLHLVHPSVTSRLMTVPSGKFPDRESTCEKLNQTGIFQSLYIPCKLRCTKPVLSFLFGRPHHQSKTNFATPAIFTCFLRGEKSSPVFYAKYYLVRIFVNH